MSLTKEEKLKEILKEYECKFHQFPSMDNPHGCTDCYNTGYIFDNPEIHMLVEYDDENRNLKEELRITKEFLKRIINANKEIKAPLYTLHPSYYEMCFAKSIIDNDLDFIRANNFLNNKED